MEPWSMIPGDGPEREDAPTQKKEIRYIGPPTRANANNSRCGRDVKG
jgi:hypothetical protein